MLKLLLSTAAASVLLAGAAYAQLADRSAVEAEARTMFEKLVAFPTVAGQGAVPKMAGYLAGELIEAGFDAGDIEMIEAGDSAIGRTRARLRDPTGSPVVR